MRRWRRSALSSLLIALAVTGAWLIERRGPGLIPVEWSFAASGRPCVLDQVLDGDSLRLTCGGKPVEVRLYCIDAPEKDQKPWGDRSRAHLKRIAADRVEMRAVDTDRFGRTVAEVSNATGERLSLNLEQVKQGQAAVYPRYCEESRFFRAEREARAARVGIWDKRGEHQTPWTFRHRH
ncbi:thermonuclease family protein [Thiocapsa marina]|uniref:Nuclease (SNase domain-containing protein) n=1 Tax=Thiocapsa marina 5811 TaxID=768671 RepID=F9UII0_9GAMM|nr:thermonuclease family protein [Thiocapsa marina]EGV16006.1 nuclease (SNase domain-containing protein) [Thiocapsa marina 5811]